MFSLRIYADFADYGIVLEVGSREREQRGFGEFAVDDSRLARSGETFPVEEVECEADVVQLEICVKEARGVVACQVEPGLCLQYLGDGRSGAQPLVGDCRVEDMDAANSLLSALVQVGFETDLAVSFELGVDS